MSKKKTSFHKFNKNIDREPQAVSTSVQVETPKLEKPVFKPTDIRVEESAPVIDIKPDAASLKDLFSELGSLLAEEPVNTNPIPTGPLPVERNAPAADPTPPLPVPTEYIEGDKDEEEDLDPLNQSIENRTTPAKVSEAKIEHLHAVADEISPPKPVATPAPTLPAPAVIETKPKKWIFKVNRNAKTNLIDSIEATEVL